MFTKVKNEKGFTLIELLIVVAIIGILAAIAIPQFSAYRQRGYNAAASSDIRNVKTTQEAIFADRQAYGNSKRSVTLAATGVTADANPGEWIKGPVSSATETVAGAAIATYIDTNADGTRDTSVGMGIGASAGVIINSGTANTFAEYVLVSQHVQGNRGFSTTGAGTAVCYAENGTWSTMVAAETASPATGIEATPPAVVTAGCNGQASGGTPITTWVAM